MRRLTIAIDCDDVLLPTAQYIVDDYANLYGFRVELQNFYSGRPEHWGVVDNKIAENRVNSYLESDRFGKVEPFLEAVEAVNRLAEKHELFMVTARTNRLASITHDMITRYFPGCFAGVELTNHFGGQENRRSKGDICQQIGADIIIDDNIHHIIDSTSKSKTFGLLFGSYEWNQIEEFAVTEMMIRCRNWAEVEREVERIANN